MAAWVAGELTVGRAALKAVLGGELTFGTLFTIAWLCAWTCGGCIACRCAALRSLLYNLLLRACK